MLDRRRFLGLTGAAAAAGVLGGLSPREAAALAQPKQAQVRFGDPASRTLVVIELEGGNDALNTLVPAVGRYHDLRPTIALGDDELLTFAGLEYGVNPALASLEPMWDAGRLAGVYGVGLPEQSRSHFVAQDAWRSARPGVPATSGWLGRWLEATPPADEVPLRAIALGRSTLAAEGEQGRPVAIQSVDGYRLAPPGGNDAVVDAFRAMASPVVAGVQGEVQRAIPDTIESVEQLQQLIDNATGDRDAYGPDEGSILFAATQAIIQGEVGTQVLYLTVGGFDTHASQRQLQDALLETVATGVSTLFDGLEATGHADRTLVLAVTEFGRRVGENASGGTDHGNGGLAMLCGPAVGASRVEGEADLDNLDRGDLPLLIDTRSVYDEALRWLGAETDVIDRVIGTDGRESLGLLAV